jgi:hypothetical protein
VGLTDDEVIEQLAALPTVDLAVIPTDTDMPLPYMVSFDLVVAPADDVVIIETDTQEIREIEPDRVAVYARRHKALLVDRRQHFQGQLRRGQTGHRPGHRLRPTRRRSHDHQLGTGVQTPSPPHRPQHRRAHPGRTTDFRRGHGPGPATIRDSGPGLPRRASGFATVRAHWPQYLAISPFYLISGVFELFPVLFSLFLAFHRWDGLGEMQYVGLQVALSQLNRSYGQDYSMIMAGALLGRAAAGGHVRAVRPQLHRRRREGRRPRMKGGGPGRCGPDRLLSPPLQVVRWNR